MKKLFVTILLGILGGAVLIFGGLFVFSFLYPIPKFAVGDSLEAVMQARVQADKSFNKGEDIAMRDFLKDYGYFYIPEFSFKESEVSQLEDKLKLAAGGTASGLPSQMRSLHVSGSLLFRENGELSKKDLPLIEEKTFFYRNGCRLYLVYTNSQQTVKEIFQGSHGGC